MIHLAIRIGIATAGVLLTLTDTRASCAYAKQGTEACVVSSRPDAVSGGDVLMQIHSLNRSNWTARLNGRDVTRSFHPVQSSGNSLALLTGLGPGKNTFQLAVKHKPLSELEILDHPLSGPIFSGPHQEPFICETAANGLGPEEGADCNAKTVVKYFYKSTAPVQVDGLELLKAAIGASPGDVPSGFKVYDPHGPQPPDVAQTVTSEGRMVNYIVRRETGTINRAVYDIQFLHQPGQPLPDPWTRPAAGWNGRLVYIFGGGCGAGHHQGVLNGTGLEQEPLLAQGYAIATSTLNVFQNNCNDRISAETLSMVKEHFIKQYGEPVRTIGQGGSGGSVQVYMIAQNYPGLLDGIIAELSFPDQMSNALSKSACPLLDHAFKTSKLHWSDEQKTAVSGFATWRICVDLLRTPIASVDARNCDHSIPKKMLYDRVLNPTGVRCDIYDNEINVYGRDPRTGFARRPFDNEGVQYGLVAFNSGKIDAEQFTELNENVGGFDEDGNVVPTRVLVDRELLPIVYQHGLLLTGGGGLSQVPIIDSRAYADDITDRHTRFWSFVTRARLIEANGNADNQIILVGARVSPLASLLNPDPALLPAPRDHDLVRQMDRWLENIATDGVAGAQTTKIARNRPPDLSDGCWMIDGERIVERATYGGPGRCNLMYPSHGDPQLAAGAPLTDEIVKCALKPLEPADYANPLSATQLARLNAVFPAGVCDYSRPGEGQQLTTATWQRY